MQGKTLHIGLRIDQLTPVHAYISVFSGFSLFDDDTPAGRKTRGLSGQLVIDREALGQFVDQIDPALITFKTAEVKAACSQWLLDYAQLLEDNMEDSPGFDKADDQFWGNRDTGRRIR